MRSFLTRLLPAVALAAGAIVLAAPGAAQAAVAPSVSCDSGGSTYVCGFTGATTTRWFLQNTYYPQLDNKLNINRTCYANTSVSISVVYYDANGVKGQVATQFVCNPGPWQ